MSTLSGHATRKRNSRAAQLTPPRVAPEAASLKETSAAAKTCQACPLWENATQTVFGEGPEHAPVMLVGEQPGDQEDLQGHPFVGPAGRLLDRALLEAGIDRDKVYVTNAVKHFKWEQRGKRRLHKKPADAEIVACHQWLERELALISPVLVVALGATAARALLGRPTAIEANRGKLMPLASGMQILITVHPSYLLRVPSEMRAQAYARFLQDLQLAVPFAAKQGPSQVQ